MHSFISSAHMFSANLDVLDALLMCFVEQVAVLLVLGLVPYPVTETLRVRSSCAPRSVVNELVEKGTAVISGLLPLLSEVKPPTIRQVFDNHQCLYKR